MGRISGYIGERIQDLSYSPFHFGGGGVSLKFSSGKVSGDSKKMIGESLGKGGR